MCSHVTGHSKCLIVSLQQRGGGVVSASDLAASDIVVTTYDVLRSDVSRQPDPEETPGGAEGGGRSLRRGKR